MRRIVFVIYWALAYAVVAQTTTPIKILHGVLDSVTVSDSEIENLVRQNLDIEQYREIKVQIVSDPHQGPGYLLVHLLSKKFHKVQFASIQLAKEPNLSRIEHNYRLKEQDLLLQPGPRVEDAKCPDESVEMIVFCPNDIYIELEASQDVANAAKAKGLHTVELYKNAATRKAYLNYMSCPKLKGNFYDGDSDPEIFTTVDGVISAKEISTILYKKWEHKVTNIWLACQAYNPPMLPAVIGDAQARKYAAGVNDLLVGPSDRAGACAMKAAIEGKPMEESFHDCYKKHDVAANIWGFGGNGSDYFND